MQACRARRRARNSPLQLTDNEPGGWSPGGFVTHSRFLVANGMEPEVKAAFRPRHRGHGYRESHCGLPKGLKRVGCKTCIRGFEVVCE